MSRCLLSTAIAFALSCRLISAGLVRAEPVPSAREKRTEVTLGSLLDEMVDLDRFTRFPSPAYVARQASSYDRASKDPADREGWFANADRGHYIRVEKRAGRTEHVMLDAPGPGVVTRIWSADPKGTLRIYIDDLERPALEAPMADLLRGGVEPFVAPLGHEAARGCNLYFPFAYARRCVMTSDEGGSYYQVGYRTYPEGTAVESYSATRLAAAGNLVARVARTLAAPGGAFTRSPGDRPVEFELAAGESPARFEIAAPPDGGVIRRLVLEPSSTEPAVLRGAVFVMCFDGEETVAAPLGDFFGAAPGINPYESLPLSVAPDGTLTCRWPMPFAETCEIELRAAAGGPLQITGQLVIAPRAWGDDSLHFHADWRADHALRTEPPRDWRFVEIDGRGVYAGNVLSVANPVRTWWGEGDEKIYVDGESFPSHFGTGTEDYYGYAWCCPEPFTHAYHNQTRCDGPGNFGHTSVNRWHVLDAIPFTRSFRFDMEVWHWDRKVEVSYSAVSFWYGRPGAAASAGRVRAETLRVPSLPELEVKVVPGALEGESLEVVASTGVVGPQDLTGFGEALWSRDAHLWWRQARPGDSLVLAFAAPAAGTHRVRAWFTKAKDYGIHEVLVNGASAGAPIDFYNDGVVPSGPVDLGVFDLVEGTNRLTVVCRGSNPRAEPKSHMFGLDCIVLEPAPAEAARPRRFRRLAVADYVDRMKAGWIGQMAGVGLGGPTEFRYQGRIIPEAEMPAWSPGLVNQFEQDDLYVEMTFLRTLEVHGLDVPIRQAGIDFAASGYPLWHANRAGRDNLRRGIAPPDSGHPRFNEHADDIDYQIEADFSGLVAPGLPNTVIALGEVFGRLMNSGDGLYGGQFVGGMYAEAFFEDDPVKIVRAGLACIPERSQYAETIRDVLRWHGELPDDWTAAWRRVNDTYHLRPEHRRGSCSGAESAYNIDAKLNGAFIALGLLYGGRDPDRTIAIATRCGQDSDCNPSNAAGVLFTSLGFSKLPERFTSALDTRGRFSHTPYDFPAVIRVCEEIARKAVVRAGGRIERDAAGREVFVIPVEEPRPGPLEQCWEPRPIAESKFTEAEMEQIRAALNAPAG